MPRNKNSKDKGKFKLIENGKFNSNYPKNYCFITGFHGSNKPTSAKHFIQDIKIVN